VQILTHEPMSVCSFQHNFPLLRLMRRDSTSCINCETWQSAIFTKRRLFALFWLTKTSPGANSHIRGRVRMQLFTYEIMSEIIGLAHAKDCDVYSLWKKRLSAELFDLHGRVPMQIFSWEDASVYNLSHNFLFCARPTCFHAVCRLQDVFMRVFAHCKTSVCTLFDLRRHVYA